VKNGKQKEKLKEKGNNADVDGDVDKFYSVSDSRYAYSFFNGSLYFIRFVISE